MTKCAVPGCETERAKRGWCRKHYLRWYRYGDPTYLMPRYDTCQVDGCDRRPRSRLSGICEMHYYRQRRHGDPLTIIDTRRDDAGYRAAHQRIAVDRGVARDHRCVDCGGPAQHWSYDHGDPDELWSPGGQPYSLDPSHYDPRCVHCHAVFDGVGANQYGPARV